MCWVATRRAVLHRVSCGPLHTKVEVGLRAPGGFENVQQYRRSVWAIGPTGESGRVLAACACVRWLLRALTFISRSCGACCKRPCSRGHACAWCCNAAQGVATLAVLMSVVQRIQRTLLSCTMCCSDATRYSMSQRNITGTMSNCPSRMFGNRTQQRNRPTDRNYGAGRRM